MRVCTPKYSSDGDLPACLSFGRIESHQQMQPPREDVPIQQVDFNSSPCFVSPKKKSLLGRNQELEGVIQPNDFVLNGAHKQEM